MEETNMSKTKSVPCARNENESEHNYHRMDDDSMVNEIETVQPTQSKTINEEDVGIILDAKKSEFNKTQLLEKDLVRKAGHLDWDCNQPIALNFSLVPRSNDTISKVDVPIEKLSVGVNCDNEYNQMGEIDVGVHGNFSWNNDYNYMNYIETEVEVETTNTTEEIEANEHGYYIDNKINSSNENVKENNGFNSRESQLQDDNMILGPTDTTQDVKSIKQTYYVVQKFVLDEHTRITRGDFHLGDERFVELSRGKQYTAVSVVALCFLRINENPAAWKTSDINDILINGDVQHHASYKKLKRQAETPQNKHLLISELYPYIKIGRNYFSFNEMNDATENGILNLNNLEASLNRFFYEKKQQNGIFTCDSYSFAIIRKPHSLFLLNSNATSYAGEPMNQCDQESAACLMQVFTIKCLANHLLVACNQGHRISDDSDETTILFSLINLNIEKIKFGKEISKRQKVSRDLRSSLSMRLEFEKIKSRIRGDENKEISHRYERKKELETPKTKTETQSVV